MTLEERVAELERRLAVLEDRATAPTPRREPPGESKGEGEGGGDEGGGGDRGEGAFWALDGLKARLAALGAEQGGVLYTGSVRLPSHERYDWQYGLPTEALLDGEAGDWTELADSFAALGHPVRLRLLREILGGRRTVAELTSLDGLGTTGQAYHHLRQLAAAGWLHSPGRGRYEVPPGRVVPLLVAVAIART